MAKMVRVDLRVSFVVVLLTMSAVLGSLDRGEGTREPTAPGRRRDRDRGRLDSQHRQHHTHNHRLPSRRTRQQRDRHAASLARDEEPVTRDLLTDLPGVIDFNPAGAPIDDNGQTLPQFEQSQESPSPNYGPLFLTNPEVNFNPETNGSPRLSNPRHRSNRRRRRHRDGNRHRHVELTTAEITDRDVTRIMDVDRDVEKASGDVTSEDNYTTGIDIGGNEIEVTDNTPAESYGALNSTGGYEEGPGTAAGGGADMGHVTAPPRLAFEQWMLRERNKQARLFMIQTRILQKLGLRHQPNFTKPSLTEDQRRRMVAIFERNLEEESEKSVFDKDDFFAKRLQFKTPSCDLPRNTKEPWREGNHFRLYFPFNKQPRSETRVSAATLRLYKKPIKDGCDCHLHRDTTTADGAADGGRKPRHADHRGRTNEQEDIALDDLIEPEEEKVRISVFYYNRPVRPKRKEKVKMVDSVMVAKSYEGWVKLNVKTAVSAWYAAPLRNFGMLVRVEDASERDLDALSVFTAPNCSVLTNTSQNSLPFAFPAVGDEAMPTGNQTSPLLDIVTIGVSENHQVERQRRDAVRRRSCVWEGVYVSFADLGWSDWVLQPLGFEAGFCRGTCATATNERELKSVAYRKNKFTHFECCGPSKLKPLQIIHYDKRGKLQISIFDNFIVTDCGCRP